MLEDLIKKVITDILDEIIPSNEFVTTLKLRLSSNRHKENDII